MTPYLSLLSDILTNGTPKSDRTGVGTLSVFGRQLRFFLPLGFPLLTTKKLHFKSIACELLWFLSGSTSTVPLHSNGVSIWDEWATEEGDLGPIYGAQWVSWPTPSGPINQIDSVLHLLKTNPNSRRILFHAWNPPFLPLDSLSPQENVKRGLMALPPCHLLYQFYVSNNSLSSHLFIRSSDVFLGLPYNIASLALLTTMFAQQTSLSLGDIVISISDAHLYTPHLPLAEMQLKRTPYPLPTLTLSPSPSIYSYTYPSSFTLSSYLSHPHIPAKVAV